MEHQVVVEPLTKQSVPTCDLKAPGKDEIANSVPQESLDREKEIKEIAEILLLCPETFLELQALYGSEVAKAACRLLPMATIDKIRESIEQRHKSISPMKPIKDLEVDRTALTCDVAEIPLEVGDTVKLYSESENLLISPKSMGKIIEIEQKGQRIKVLVQWEDGKQSEYFGEDRVKTTGSYFIDIKEIRKMICKEGKYYAATL